MKKKLLSTVLALCMIFALLPVSAMAEGDNETESGKDTTAPENTSVFPESKNGYIELTEDVTLSKDVEISCPIVVKSGNITINGEGHTIEALNGDFTKGITGNVAAAPTLIYVTGGASLTIKDVTVNANEKCRVIGADKAASTADKASLIIDGSTITGGSVTNQRGAGVFLTSTATFEMYDSKITGNKIDGTNAEKYYNKYSQDLWVGANATGKASVIENSIINNIFVNSNEWSGLADKGFFELEGGYVKNLYVEYYKNQSAVFTHTSGTIEKLMISKQDNTGDYIEIINPDSGITYEGGAVAQRDKKAIYKTLQAAIDGEEKQSAEIHTLAKSAVTTDSETVIMLTNITENIEIPENSNITLDLNGYTLTQNGDDKVITNNGTLTITDSSNGQGEISGEVENTKNAEVKVLGTVGSSVGEALENVLTSKWQLKTNDKLSYYDNINEAIEAAVSGNGGVVTQIKSSDAGASSVNIIVTLKNGSTTTTINADAGENITLPTLGKVSGGWVWLSAADGVRYELGSKYEIKDGGNTFTAVEKNVGGASSRYTVIIESGILNGSITSSHESADKGSVVTITATPNAGYKLDTITATDAEGGQLSLTDAGDGKYTFVMPALRVNVSASFANTANTGDTVDIVPTPTIPMDMPFSDVAAGAWYKDAAKYVYEKGMMSGTSDKTFSPDATMTRGMIVTILYRLEGQPEVGVSEFTDVQAGQYYAKAIAYASEKGIVSGYGDGRFGPNDIITREQMAVILYRYAQNKGYDVKNSADLSSFTDQAQVSAYAAEAMKWANAAGLINGVGGNKLSPNGSATRAQAASILMRFCENIAK